MEERTSTKKLFTLFEGGDAHLREDVEPHLPVAPETGRRLAQARKQLSLSVSDVAGALYLSERYIAAIEARDYDEMPSIAYATGYVRAYANYVNIDADELIKADPELGLEAIDEELDATQEALVDAPMSQSLNSSSPWITTAFRLLSVLALVTVALLAWNFWDDINAWWVDRVKQEKIIQIEEESAPPALPENPQRQIGTNDLS